MASQAQNPSSRPSNPSLDLPFVYTDLLSASRTSSFHLIPHLIPRAPLQSQHSSHAPAAHFRSRARPPVPSPQRRLNPVQGSRRERCSSTQLQGLCRELLMFYPSRVSSATTAPQGLCAALLIVRRESRYGGTNDKARSDALDGMCQEQASMVQICRTPEGCARTCMGSRV